MKELTESDPVSTLLDLHPSYGKFELSADGYECYYPSDEELAVLNESYGQQIEQIEADHKPYFQQVRANIEAYRAMPTTTDGGETTVLTLPILGREIDQIVAGEVTTCMRPRPVVSVDPYFEEKYEVLATTQTDPATGQPLEAPAPTSYDKDAESVARAWELALDYKLREQLDLRTLLKYCFKDIHIAGRHVAKCIHEPEYRTVKVAKTKKAPEGWVEVLGSEERKILDGQATRLINIPPFNFFMPLDENNIQKARLVFENVPLTSTEIREKLSAGECPLVPETEWEALLKATSTTYLAEADQQIRRNVDGRSPSKPAEKHDIKEVWFYHPVKIQEVDEATGKKKTRYRVLSLFGHYHKGARRFLFIDRNPYNHGKRPYEVVFEDEEQGRFASASTAGRASNHQKLISQMVHLQIQTKVACNTPITLSDPDSDTYAAIKDYGGKVKPGQLLPWRGNESDYKSVRLAEAGPDLSADIGFVSNDLSMTTGVSQWEQGFGAGANRTAAATVNQIMSAGMQRPLMVLGAVSDFLSRLLRMYLETLKQFEPFGEIVPVRDPETNDLLQVPMRFPVEPVFDNFRIALTAADEALAKEAEDQERLMRFQTIMQANQTFIQMAGAMRDPNASPALTDVMKSLFDGSRKALELYLEGERRDTDKFLPSKDAINKLLAEKEQEMMMQQMQMQQQQMMQQQGGMPPNGVPGNQQPPMGGMGQGQPDAGAPPPSGPPVG